MKRNINQLLNPVYKITEQWFSEQLVEFSKLVTKRLMHKAEASPSFSIQSECFVAIHNIQSTTKSAISAFISSLSKRFLTTDFQKSINKSGLTEKLININHKNIKLNLMATRELEENQSFENAVVRLTEQNQEAFEHLEIRIYELLKNSSEHIRDNPVSAESILSAFRDSMDRYKFSAELRTDIYSLFQKFLSSRLPGLLKLLNDHLIKKGVLPEIETSYFISHQFDGNDFDSNNFDITNADNSKQRKTVVSDESNNNKENHSRNNAQNIAQNNTQINVQNEEPHLKTSLSRQPASSLNDRLLDLANRLAHQKAKNPNIRTAQSDFGQPSSINQPSFQSVHVSEQTLTSKNDDNKLAVKQAYLKNKRHHISNNVLSSPRFQHNISTGELINAVNDIKKKLPVNHIESTESIHHQLKENILTKSNKHHQSTVLKHDKLHFIDMIESLFLHVSENKNLSLTARYLFRGLMIPIIHLALVDKKFFSDEQHPARQFLNDFADASLSITDGDSKTNNPLYLKLEKVVTQLSRKNTVNKASFSEVHADLKRFIEYRKQHANAKSSVSRAAIEAKIDIILRNFIKDKKLPSGITFILNNIWKSVMLSIYIDDNCTDDDWDRAISFINALILSIKPAQTLAQRILLAESIQIINHDFEAGLIRLHCPDALKTKLFQLLKKYHLFALGKVNHFLPENLFQTERSPEQSQQEPGNNGDFHNILFFEKNLETDALADEVESIHKNINFKPSPMVVTSFEEAFIDKTEPQFKISKYKDEKEAKKKNESEKLSETDYELIQLVNKGSKTKQKADQYTDTVKHLKVDDCLEFRFTSHYSRAKITWIKANHSQFIFLTQNDRIIEMSLETLSDSFRQGTAIIIQSSAIINDAIEAIEVTGFDTWLDQDTEKPD